LRSVRVQINPILHDSASLDTENIYAFKRHRSIVPFTSGLESVGQFIALLNDIHHSCVKVGHDSTPSEVNLCWEGGVAMRPGRLGLSSIDKREIWSRWKAGQTLHEIGRVYGKRFSTKSNQGFAGEDPMSFLGNHFIFACSLGLLL
jgi:hypothetical protein